MISRKYDISKKLGYYYYVEWVRGKKRVEWDRDMLNEVHQVHDWKGSKRILLLFG